jgi:hypothetical protein
VPNGALTSNKLLGSLQSKYLPYIVLGGVGVGLGVGVGVGVGVPEHPDNPEQLLLTTSSTP